MRGEKRGLNFRTGLVIEPSTNGANNGTDDWAPIKTTSKGKFLTPGGKVYHGPCFLVFVFLLVFQVVSVDPVKSPYPSWADNFKIKFGIRLNKQKIVTLLSNINSFLKCTKHIQY